MSDVDWQLPLVQAEFSLAHDMAPDQGLSVTLPTQQSDIKHNDRRLFYNKSCPPSSLRPRIFTIRLDTRRTAGQPATTQQQQRSVLHLVRMRSLAQNRK